MAANTTSSNETRIQFLNSLLCEIIFTHFFNDDEPLLSETSGNYHQDQLPRDANSYTFVPSLWAFASFRKVPHVLAVRKIDNADLLANDVKI
jgi:hypothetical protein